MVVVGKLTKTQGLKGEIRMQYYGNSPDELKLLKDARIVKSDGSAIDIELEKVRESKNTHILKFKGVDSIDDAEKLIGSFVHIDIAELKELEKNEYYWDDLIGMSVYDNTGELIGRLASIFETAGNDVYVVKRGIKELLIPAIEDVIKEVDVDNKKMCVHLLKGMRDDF
jgi:16S rRNA processing protein RimM